MTVGGGGTVVGEMTSPRNLQPSLKVESSLEITRWSHRGEKREKREEGRIDPRSARGGEEKSSALPIAPRARAPPPALSPIPSPRLRSLSTDSP